MLRRTIFLLVPTLGFWVALLAAMKASVEGNLFWYVRLLFFIALGIAPAMVWLFWTSGRKLAMLRFGKKLYLFTFIGIFLSFPALLVIDKFLDPALVSNRSFGSVIGSLLYFLFGYALWYFAIYRGAASGSSYSIEKS